MRLFIGLALSEEAKRGVRKVVKKLQRGRWPIRWEPEEKWHLTIKFVGPTSAKSFGEVKAVVERACQNIQPFTLKFKGLGSFPDLLLPRVVWLGVKGDLKSFYKLAKSITDEVIRPHVTLGRIKPSMSRKQRLELGKIIAKNRILDILQTWSVDRVTVYESRKDGITFSYSDRFTKMLSG